jgi:hypothetical protein
MDLSPGSGTGIMIQEGKEIMNESEEKEMNQIEGTDFENAIIFESVENNFMGVMMEYQYLNARYPSGEKLQQRLCENGDRRYDIITLRFPDGMIQEIYFDITNFFGKGMLW